MPNFNIYFKIKCKVSRKKFGGKKIKNKKIFAECQIWHSAKSPFTKFLLMTLGKG